jgi:hypothetical protein
MGWMTGFETNGACSLKLLITGLVSLKCLILMDLAGSIFYSLFYYFRSLLRSSSTFWSTILAQCNRISPCSRLRSAGVP